jgi:hypothetical protein
MRRLRSGSTPHDVVIADPAPLRSAPFPPALARQRTRLRRSATPPGHRTAHPVEQRAIRSFAPARAPKIQAKAIRSPASPQPPKHSRRRQIPIAPAALSVPHTPRFPALALFGRRPPERVDDLCIPASENLHNNGSNLLHSINSSARGKQCRRGCLPGARSGSIGPGPPQLTDIRLA